MLEATFVVQVVRPYSTRRATEIVSAPKVYGLEVEYKSLEQLIARLSGEPLG